LQVSYTDCSVLDLEKGGRGWTAVLNPGHVLGEEAGLEVEEEMCRM
jgi:hypothetical protein